MDVALTLNDTAWSRQLTNIEKVQLPFAGAMALNDTAAEALQAVQKNMAIVFDRPTRFTLNYLMVWRATKRTLEARVQPRPSAGKRHYLRVQETGGQRPVKGFEGLLARASPYSGIIAAVTPAAGARLDAYGNWSSGERNQVLSALGAQRDALSNTTEASAKRKKGRASYFVPRNGGLSPGVYKKARPGAKPVKVLHFLDSLPVYTPRLEFAEKVLEVWSKRFADHMDRRLAEAVATAR